jgi:homoserine kinase type II
LRPGITYEPLLRRARDVVARVLPWAERALRPWESESLPLQTCIRDLRGEHVLFVGATIGGIVDFGALAQDHVATDLARLLSDFAWEDDERFRLGLEAYRAAGGPAVSTELVRVLTKTGVPCSIVGWLIRLLVERKPWEIEAAAATRLQVLVERAERFTPE